VLTRTRAQGWGIVGRDAGPQLLAITRKVGEFLEAQDFMRIETSVRTEFPAAHRWARMLGFQREGTLRKWDEGRDCDIYARVK
jgi:RimJ/RimL family protein N-acetyltransferase